MTALLEEFRMRQFNPSSFPAVAHTSKGWRSEREDRARELSSLLGKYSYICFLLDEGTHLEVKDASIVLYKGLVMRYDSTE